MVMSGHMMALRRSTLDAFFTAARPNDIATLSFRMRRASLHCPDGHYHKGRGLSRHPIGRSGPKHTRLQAAIGKHQEWGNGGDHMIDPLTRERFGERPAEIILPVLRHDRFTRIPDRPADRS
jgi:hypothetical protein